MSNSIYTARPDRREEQLIKDVSRRRPLYSALSVLVGTGAVALSTLPSQAQAKSALDDMAWAPQQQTRLTQQPAVSPAVGTAVNEAVSILKVAAQDDARAAVAGNPVSGSARGVAARVDAASTSAQSTASAPVTQGAIAPAFQGRVEPVAMPRSKGFAHAGLIPLETPALSAPSASTDAIAPREVQPASQATEALLSAHRVRAVLSRPTLPAPLVQAVPPTPPTPPSVSVSPIRPALSIKRVPDMQADIIALRGNLAAGTANKFDGESMSNMASAQPDMPAGRDTFARTANAPAQKGAQKGRGVEDNYADWLDDTRSVKTLADNTVVPEGVVRTALRNAAEIAAERSAAVRQARNDWDAAKFDVDQVKGQRWPQVQVGANSPALRGSANTFDDSNRSTANISVTTMVYDWGKTSKNIDSRTKTAEAAEFYYETVAQQNAYEVSSNLVELAKNRAVYSIGESYVRRMAALVQMLEEIVKIDPGRLSELTQAKSRLLQAQTSQAVVAAQVRSLELSVRKLVGDEPTPLPSGTQWQLQLDGLDSAVAAVQQNPAIEQAIAEAAAAKATAKSVRAGSLPQLNWVINKTTAPDTFGQRQPWTTMLQLSWTPFQGGSQQAAERAALSRASSSDDKREQLQLDSEFKVRDAHRDAIALATRAKLYSQLSVETDLIRKQFFEQWYHLNRRSLVDVLSAESDFYNNQVSAVTTQFDAYQSVLKIHLNNGTLEQWLKEA